MREDPIDWNRELRHTWPLLTAPEGTKGIATAPLALDLPAGRALLGLDMRGDHHLLLPLLGRDEVIEDLGLAHVRLFRRQLVIEDVASSYLDLVCHRHDLHDLFDDLLVDVLRAAEGAEDATRECVRVVNRWRDLLRRRGGTLSESAIRGLVGELFVLDRIARAASGRLDVTSTWTGPDRLPHDFEMTHLSVEVKTTGAFVNAVEVHGVEQLAALPESDLVLVLVRLEADEEGTSLPQLVEELSRRMDRAAFLGQLAKAGYSVAQAEVYADRRYTPLQVLPIPVTGDFPRIVGSSFAHGRLPRGVEDLAYRADLTRHLPTAIQPDDFDRLLQEKAVR